MDLKVTGIVTGSLGLGEVFWPLLVRAVLRESTTASAAFESAEPVYCTVSTGPFALIDFVHICTKQITTHKTSMASLQSVKGE